MSLTMSKTSVLVLSIVYVSFAEAHILSSGPCPKLDAVETLDMERFLGQWYVLHRADTRSKCLKDYIYMNEEGTLKMSQEKIISNSFVEDVILNMTSTLLPSRSPGIIKIRHNSIFMQSTMRVIATDYNNYALIYKCKPMGFFHRWSASILARDMNYNNTQIIKKLFVQLESQDVDTTEIFPVDHSSCISVKDSNLAINFDGDELSGDIEGKYVDTVKETIDSFREESEPPKEETNTFNKEQENEIET